MGSGTPLHACCAMHAQAGALEMVHLLLKKGADIAAGDAEGDTPLSHARYFRADEMYAVLERNGAKLGGPFYSYRTFGHDSNVASSSFRTPGALRCFTFLST